MGRETFFHCVRRQLIIQCFVVGSVCEARVPETFVSTVHNDEVDFAKFPESDSALSADCELFSFLGIKPGLVPRGLRTDAPRSEGITLFNLPTENNASRVLVKRSHSTRLLH